MKQGVSIAEIPDSLGLDILLKPHPAVLGEHILDESETNYSVWIPSAPCIVLGSHQKVVEEVHSNNLLQDNIPVYKRQGGGGAVYLSPESLCFTYQFARGNRLNISGYYQHMASTLLEWLKYEVGIVGSLAGKDLTYKGRKFFGCSLKVKRDAILYYGCFLIKDCVKQIERYLKHPSREPEYRNSRNHQDFLIPLSEIKPDFTVLKAQQSLREFFLKHPEISKNRSEH